MRYLGISGNKRLEKFAVTCLFFHKYADSTFSGDDHVQSCINDLQWTRVLLVNSNLHISVHPDP